MTDKSNNYVPSDYQDLYAYYIIDPDGKDTLCKKLVRAKLPYSTDDEKETLVHDVFLRLLDKKMLEKFDPSKANFGGVIYFVTRSIVSNHLDKKTRNPLTGLNGGSLYTTDPEDSFEPGMYSLDRLFGEEAPKVESLIEMKQEISALMEWAISLYQAPRHKRDESLYPLLQLLAEDFDPKECGAKLEVTPSTIHNWIAVLRDKVQEIRFKAQAGASISV